MLVHTCGIDPFGLLLKYASQTCCGTVDTTRSVLVTLPHQSQHPRFLLTEWAQLLRTLTCRLLHSTQPVLDFVWGFRGIMALGALFSRVESRRSEGLCSDLINQGLGGQGYVAGKTRGTSEVSGSQLRLFALEI